MIRHIASNAITFLIVALFLLAGVIAWGGNTYRAEGPLETAICLQVPSGSNFRDVRDDLTAEGAISQPWLFMAGADYSEKTNQLKAGSFLIEDGASMAEIVDAITGSGVSTCGTEIVYRIGVTRSEVQVRELDPATNRFGEVASFNPLEEEAPAEYIEAKEGQDTRYRIAVAEGVTSWQIANSLNAIDVLDGEIAEIPAEGSLAPDSYEFRPGDEASEIKIFDYLDKLNDQAKSTLKRAKRGGTVQIYDIKAKIIGNSSYKLPRITPVLIELTN